MRVLEPADDRLVEKSSLFLGEFAALCRQGHSTRDHTPRVLAGMLPVRRSTAARSVGNQVDQSLMNRVAAIQKSSRTPERCLNVLAVALPQRGDQLSPFSPCRAKSHCSELVRTTSACADERHDRAEVRQRPDQRDVGR
jgi:hypothetical protein